MRLSAHCAALAALALAVSACDRNAAEPTAAAPASSEAESLTPLPPARFAESTDEQRAMRRAAIDAMNAGNEDVALTALLSLMQSEPASEIRAIGGLLLAQLYHRRDELDRSLAVLETLRETAPPSAEFAFVYGSTLVDADRPAEAADALLRATRLDPEYVRAYPMLAALQSSLDQEERARETLLALERQLVRLARELESGPSTERTLEILRRLRIGFPHADAARAAASVLDAPNEAIVEASLNTLERVGTVDVLPALTAMAEGGGPHAERADAVARSIASREAAP